MGRGHKAGYAFLIFLVGLRLFNFANTLMDGNPVTPPIFFFLTGVAVSHGLAQEELVAGGNGELSA